MIPGPNNQKQKMMNERTDEEHRTDVADRRAPVKPPPDTDEWMERKRFFDVKKGD